MQPSTSDTAARLDRLESQVRRFRLATIALAAVLVCVVGAGAAAQLAPEQIDKMSITHLTVQDLVIKDNKQQLRGVLGWNEDGDSAKLSLFQSPIVDDKMPGSVGMDASKDHLVLGALASAPHKNSIAASISDGISFIRIRDKVGDTIFVEPKP
jgi:hypothetical protein